VALPGIAPALATVAADCLARLGHQPIVVLNRAGGSPDPAAPPGSEPTVSASLDSTAGWSARPAHRLPDSRMGAQLALGGREARGELGRAIADLADRCQATRAE
jgi:hypothetical protein